MVIGNLVALAQRNLKRMLAYSSIAHAGYLLAAVWPGSWVGAGATLLYLAAYGLTTLASFGILAVLGRGGERDVTLDTIAGLARHRPAIAFALSVCMLSLLGFPGTLGFIGKWIILTAVVAEHHALLAVVLVVTSLISAGYYLPVIMAVYMKEPESDAIHDGVSLPFTAGVVVAVSVVALLLFGIWPQPVMDRAMASARTFVEHVGVVAGR